MRSLFALATVAAGWGLSSYYEPSWSSNDRIHCSTKKKNHSNLVKLNSCKRTDGAPGRFVYAKVKTLGRGSFSSPSTKVAIWHEVANVDRKLWQTNQKNTKFVHGNPIPTYDVSLGDDERVTGGGCSSTQTRTHGAMPCMVSCSHGYMPVELLNMQMGDLTRNVATGNCKRLSAAGLVAAQVNDDTGGVFSTDWTDGKDSLTRLVSGVFSVPLFVSKMSQAEVSHLNQSMEKITFLAGTVIFRQGDPADRFYIIESGEADVMVHKASLKKVGDKIRSLLDLYHGGKKVPKGTAGVVEKFDASRILPFTFRVDATGLRLRVRQEEMEQLEGAPSGEYVATLGAGDYFGEQSTFKRSATVIVKKRLICLSISRENFKKFVDEDRDRFYSGKPPPLVSTPPVAVDKMKKKLAVDRNVAKKGEHPSARGGGGGGVEVTLLNGGGDDSPTRRLGIAHTTTTADAMDEKDLLDESMQAWSMAGKVQTKTPRRDEAKVAEAKLAEAKEIEGHSIDKYFNWVRDTVESNFNRLGVERNEVFFPKGEEKKALRKISPTHFDVQKYQVPRFNVRQYLNELPEAEMIRLINAMEMETFAPGTVIFREGDANDNFFFIQSGEAAVLVRGGRRPASSMKLGDKVSFVRDVYFDGKKVPHGSTGVIVNFDASRKVPFTVLVDGVNQRGRVLQKWIGLRDQHVATLHGGDFFGEQSIIKRVPRAETVIATKLLTCLSITREKFRHFLFDDKDKWERYTGIKVGAIHRRSVHRRAPPGGLGGLGKKK